MPLERNVPKIKTVELTEADMRECSRYYYDRARRMSRTVVKVDDKTRIEVGRRPGLSPGR